MEITLRQDWTESGRELTRSIMEVYQDESGELIIEKHSVDEETAIDCRIVVKRIDKEPIRSWRILQNVKNAVCGPDAVAFEKYPKESEVSDVGNLYHLWVLKPDYDIPVLLIPGNI